MTLILKEVIERLEVSEIFDMVDVECATLFEKRSQSIEVILSSMKRYPELCPTLKGANENELISKWLKKYFSGYGTRASARISKTPGTTADPAVDFIIQCYCGNLSDEEIDRIKYSHRLSMSAENILGLYLEEYLAINLFSSGWHCCWGETMKSVDFCHNNLSLLQIKNRSNSENSSSSKVRFGTTIEKWFRIDAKSSKYKWEELNRKIGISNLSEDDFRVFIKKSLTSNMRALALDSTSPWFKSVKPC